MKIGCVIPCYKGGSVTLQLVKKLFEIVDLIVLIDDCCPLNTGKRVLKEFSDKKLIVLINKINKGVGFSTIKGFKTLIKNECDIIVKIDADGQMNPNLIPSLIKPIIAGKSEASKGNRFTNIDDLASMPKVRVFGNLGLSFLSKLSSGYWELFDPTNGFIAFKSSALDKLRLDKVDNRYFFESDLLFQCGLANISFSQLSMKSNYLNEVSSLKPEKEFIRFLIRHVKNTFKRLIYQYFLLDFNIGSLQIICVLITSILLSIVGIKIFITTYFYDTLTTSGEANLFSILVIVLIQFILAFIFFDATQQPLIRRLTYR